MAVTVLACVALAIALDGGIQVARENHAGLIPVVRRLLDPAWLPGDFGIELRAHHHRVFAWMVAVLWRPFGMHGAFALLTVAGYALVFAATWTLGRSVGLDAARRALLCVALACGALFLDHGVEANRLLGNGPIMPPTFAHGAIVLGIAMSVRGRHNLAGLCAGLALLVHLQIGAIWLAAWGVLLIAQGTWRTPRAWLPGLVGGVLLASPALLDLVALSRQGLTQGIGQLTDVAFRMPQHFEFRAGRVAAVLLWLAVLVACVRHWHRVDATRARLFAAPCIVALTLAAFTALHYLDYHLLQTGVVSRIQLLRLSLLIPLLGALALLSEWQRHAGTAQRTRHAPAALTAVFALVACGAALGKGDPLTLRVVDASRDGGPWSAVTAWVRAHGPAGLYATPPGQTGFAAFAERSTLVEFKVNPDGGAGLAEWQARLAALAGGTLPTATTRTQVARALDAAYAHRTDADWAAVRARWGVTHAVVPVDARITGTELHRNAGYRVVALP